MKQRLNSTLSKYIFYRNKIDGLYFKASRMEGNTIFTISFDCDNEEDADSFPWLLDILDKYGVKASYAVCGKMVEENSYAYQQLILRGHEIVNHGYSKHLLKEDGHLISTLFYDRMPHSAIRHEISKNHEIIKKVLGYEMKGFRVPHFGYFQNYEQIRFLFGLLQELGYTYDSSLTAFNYLRYKRKLSKNFSLVEFPLSPNPAHFRGVLDSWGYLKAPNSIKKSDDFVHDFKKLITWATTGRERYHINMYVDPSHVLKWNGFEECLLFIKNFSNQIRIRNYQSIISVADETSSIQRE